MTKIQIRDDASSLLLILFIVTTVGYAGNPSTDQCIAFESSYHVEQACQCLVYESFGQSQGSFNSVNFPQAYPAGVNCVLYTFIGDLGEIVEVEFVEFDLQPPSSRSHNCGDYVNLYVDLERPEVAEQGVPGFTLCGNRSNLAQTKYYSSQRSLILEFHADTRQTNNTGFRGIYRFLDKDEFQMEGGSRRWEAPCTFDFYSSRVTNNGKLFSPGYPQNYPPNSVCLYYFHAQPDERVQITFKSLQLQPSDTRCARRPDVITVRDGATRDSPVLAIHCGNTTSSSRVTSSQPIIVSSGHSALLEFVSDEVDQRQGFAATFRFLIADKVSSLVQVTQPTVVIPSSRVGRHPPPIKPSAPAFDVNTNDPRDSPIVQSSHLSADDKGCGGKISSSNGKTNIITSPLYPKPYPSDRTCHFVFEGRRDERVQLRFHDFQLHYSLGNPHEPHDCDESDSVTVTVTLGDSRRDLDTYCGSKFPPAIMSTNHRLDVLFVSRPRPVTSSPQPRGFNATYNFVTNFAITSGLQHENKQNCIFEYRSSTATNGTFTSPNYPGLYPRDTECHYLFYGNDRERIHIRFIFFDVEGVPPACLVETQSDYVIFSNFNVNLIDRKMSPLCGPRVPPGSELVVSDGHFFRLSFKSNDVFDAVGFDAYYEFVVYQDVFAVGKRRMAVGGMTSSSDVIVRSPRVSVSVSLLLSISLSYRTCCVRQSLTSSVQ